RASFSERACSILNLTTCFTPSPSATICSASERQTLSSALSNCVFTCLKGMPLLPLASSSTVSLVEVSPSTDMLLKLSSTARRSSLCKSPGEAATSVNRRSEEHTSELQSLAYLVCRLLLEK